MADRWLKLTTNWMESEWLLVLSAESRLAWVQLLCYVKGHGSGGRVKIKSASVFARQNFMGEESVDQMLRAAKMDGAITEDDGSWVVTNWPRYQGDETNAERQRRFKLNKKEALNNGGNALANGGNVEEKRREEKRNPLTPKGAEVKPFDGFEIPESFLKAATAWAKYRTSMNHKPWKYQTWELCMKKYQGDPGRFGRAVAFTMEMQYQGLAEPHGQKAMPVAQTRPRSEAGVAQ